MSVIRNALKRDVLNNIKKRTRKSGRRKRGERPEIGSSLPIQPVPCAVILAECLTIPELKYTVNPNTSILPTQNLIAGDVIWVSIMVTSSAGNVEKLQQNKKMNSAIDALLRRIRNELYFAESTISDSKTKAMRSTGRRLQTDGGVQDDS